jgi:hypothetical protein
MSIGEIIASLSAAIGILSIFVEFSKIKVNPLSAVLKWIGKKITEDLKEDLKEVKTEQERILKEQEMLARQRAIDAADAIKVEIFRFYNECQKGERHSEGEFNHIIQQNKKYEVLMEELKEPNGVYEMEYKYIMKIYEKCQKENDFL